ncbi:hypothetical protein JCM33374_g366 [Metschnikowia sp. JCM 33374]|nr:hypothetical protein JCM33374_g366 [Metschnikowia sp. JCM 33374]
MPPLSNRGEHEKQRHLSNDCACTKSWWNLLNIETSMHLTSMLAPLHNTDEPLRNLNWYVETVRRIALDAEGREEWSCSPHLKKAMGHSKAKTS